MSDKNGEQKKVLLGITGCIAAYKAAEIVRCLQKAGIDVVVVMTENATKFITPLTFEAICGHPVMTDTFNNPDCPIPHIRLAEECDAFLIAPCTANVCAKIAFGIADDLLTSTALACTAPLIVAPAMNVHMYENQATQHNLETLKARGIHVIDADSGYLACGDVGSGRLPEPDVIGDFTLSILHNQKEGSKEDVREYIEDSKDPYNSKAKASKSLSGKNVLIITGPTIEPIDAVRFISNRSSGKMGYALIEAALQFGASVKVISGPISLQYPETFDVEHVETADQMLISSEANLNWADIVICVAAVSDYKPDKAPMRKLKKGIDDKALSEIHMVKNPDILATLSSMRRENQIFVGFAAETDDVISCGKSKLVSKGVDMIVANKVGTKDGFGQDIETATIITSDLELALENESKRSIATEIIREIAKIL